MTNENGKKQDPVWMYGPDENRKIWNRIEREKHKRKKGIVYAIVRGDISEVFTTEAKRDAFLDWHNQRSSKFFSLFDFDYDCNDVLKDEAWIVDGGWRGRKVFSDKRDAEAYYKKRIQNAVDSDERWSIDMHQATVDTVREEWERKYEVKFDTKIIKYIARKK